MYLYQLAELLGKTMTEIIYSGDNFAEWQAWHFIVKPKMELENEIRNHVKNKTK